MCRRLLVQPSSNTAETNQLIPPFDPPFDPEIAAGELERQIRHHVDLLRARLEGMTLPSPESDPPPTRDENTLVVNEFSGMYS